MKKHNILLILTILYINLIPFRGGSFSQISGDGLQCGTAKVNITPPVGTWLAGFGSRKTPSDGILDDLYAKMLVLSDGKTKIAMVTADLLWFPADVTKNIRTLIEEKIGIPSENVFLSASHTHYGPLMREYKVGPFSRFKADYAYLCELEEKIAGAVSAANMKMTGITIGTAKGRIPELIYNRRPTKNDSLIMLWNMSNAEPEFKYGPTDPEVGIIRIDNTQGNSVATLINYACHPVIGGDSMPSMQNPVSADYVGYTAKVIETFRGGICMFTLGTAGNMNPVYRGENGREKTGYALGGEVLKQIQFAKKQSFGRLKTVRKIITIPLKEQMHENRIIDFGTEAEEITAEVQGIAIGDIILIGLPGEVLVEIGLALKEKSNHDNLFVVSLANDAIGYICLKEAYKYGGYEPGSGSNLAEGGGELIMNTALDIIRELKSDR